MKFRYIFIILIIFSFTSTAFATWLPDRYHTYEEMEVDIHQMAESYPEITKMDTLGYVPCLYEDIYGDMDSMAIYAMKISDNPEMDEDEPVLVFNGIHHAEEIIGMEIVFYMMEDLLTRYSDGDQEAINWINDNEIWLIPMINPRGHKIVVDSIDVAYRKNTRDNNGNGQFDCDPGISPDGYPPYDDLDGVDLNRNYDFNWADGDSSWESETYRGPAPFSEPETQAIRDFFYEVRPIFCINYHSSRSGNYSEYVLYPWRTGTILSPDYNHIRSIASNIAQRIPKDDGMGNYNTVYGSFYGGFARNWMYGEMGTFAYVVEAGSMVLPPGPFVDIICEKNLTGAYFIFDRIQNAQITGIITDGETGEPLQATVRILEAAIEEPMAERTSHPVHGRYRRLLLPNLGPYTLQVEKEGYTTVTLPNIEVSNDSITTVNVVLEPTSVEYESYTPTAPERISLEQNYPNPFNPTTTITYSLPTNGHVSLNIYNTLGQKIETLIDKNQPAGEYSIKWNAESLSSGVYFYTLDAHGKQITKKLVLLK